MSDAELRELERKAALGDEEARLALEAARRRAGTAPGAAALLELLRASPGGGKPSVLHEWALGLAAWGPEACLRAGLAAISVLGSPHELVRVRFAFEAWLAEPGPTTRAEVEAAVAALPPLELFQPGSIAPTPGAIDAAEDERDELRARRLDLEEALSALVQLTADGLAVPVLAGQWQLVVSLAVRARRAYELERAIVGALSEWAYATPDAVPEPTRDEPRPPSLPREAIRRLLGLGGNPG